MLVWVAFLAQLNATGMKQADRIRHARLRDQGAATLAAGAAEREITKAIWQMAVYGGLPAAIKRVTVGRAVCCA